MGSLFSWERDGLLDEPRATELTRPFWSTLVSIWQGSHEQWLEIPDGPRGRLAQFKIVKSSVLNAFARSIAFETLGETAQIAHCRKLGFWKWYLIDSETGHHALLRFKVLRSDLLVSPSKTRQARAYYNNAPIEGLDNSATRINVGCTIGIDGIEAMYLTCQRGQDHIFKIALSLPAIVPLPTPAVQSSTAAIGPKKQTRNRKGAK
jgi:hypothetical protein